MAKNLDVVLERMHNLVHRHFGVTETLQGIIDKIEPEQHRFMLRDQEGIQAVECRTFDDISRFQPGDFVTVKGTFKFYPSSSLHMYLLAEYVTSITEQKVMDAQLKVYNSLKRALLQPKYQKAIRKLRPLHPPTSILNVGLIATSYDALAVDNFKAMFAERCNGKLFIYRLRSHEVGDALHYFKTYHHIDLICLLAIKQPVTVSINLSAKPNVVYMLNRTDMPYVMAVTAPCEPDAITPLTSMLANEEVKGINACIESIQRIQSNFRIRLTAGILDGECMFDDLVSQQRALVSDARRLIAEMANPSFDSGTITSHLAHLKHILILRFQQEKQILAQVQHSIASSLIGDHRVSDFITKMFVHERVNPDDPAIPVPPQPIDALFDVFADPSVMPRSRPLSPPKKIENKMGDGMDDAMSADIIRTHGF
ncbi:Hypothetical protein MVR_LOCUS6 [uncultured virus]|nr:Hypothetical protein MVR_LOCUS6 [uncultured virus]